MSARIISGGHLSTYRFQIEATKLFFVAGLLGALFISQFNGFDGRQPCRPVRQRFGVVSPFFFSETEALSNWPDNELATFRPVHRFKRENLATRPRRFD
ncbi:MAG: hypothetical protein AB7K24_12385 [Gemmataceae bacterium]